MKNLKPENYEGSSERFAHFSPPVDFHFPLLHMLRISSSSAACGCEQRARDCRPTVCIVSRQSDACLRHAALASRPFTGGCKLQRCWHDFLHLHLMKSSPPSFQTLLCSGAVQKTPPPLPLQVRAAFSSRPNTSAGLDLPTPLARAAEMNNPN